MDEERRMIEVLVMAQKRDDGVFLVERFEEGLGGEVKEV